MHDGCPIIARIAWRLEQGKSAVDGIYFASELRKTEDDV